MTRHPIVTPLIFFPITLYWKHSYVKVINEIGFDRFRLEVIENYSCEDLYQPRQREGHWISELGTLNKCIAGRTTVKNILKINRDKILKKTKEHNENNVDKIKEYKKNMTKDTERLIMKKKRKIKRI